MLHICQINLFKLGFIENISFFHIYIKGCSIVYNYKNLEKQYLFFVVLGRKDLVNLYLLIEVQLFLFPFIFELLQE